MSYADPQSVTINAIPISLPRIGSGPGSGTFQSADGLVGLSVNHVLGRRNRRTLRLTSSKISADPFIPNQNVKVSMSTYIVVDTPVNGYTTAEAKQVVDGLVAYLTASSGARVTQLLGGEN
jgi:hypothetical protein